MTKTAERISFFVFFIVLFITSMSTLIILSSFLFPNFNINLLSKAIASIPALWLLTIITLSNAFRFANVANQKEFDKFVDLGIYYFIVVLTLGLLPSYVLYVYLMCNRKRTFIFSIEPLIKLLGLIPFINFFVMFSLIKSKISLAEKTKLFLSFSLARHIYLNYKTTNDIFN